MNLNQSEKAVLEYIHRDGHFTKDPGQRQRINNAADTLVRKRICKFISHPRHFRTARVALDDTFKTLVELGARTERREDSEGKTRTGWWMDGVWLAPANRPMDALRELKGG